MELSSDERTVMDRFAEKTHIAGGATAGYMLRRAAIARTPGDAFDADAAIAALVDRGLLATDESGGLVYLTEAGVEALG